jgi:starch synthase
VLLQHADHLSGILNGVDYGVWNPATDSLIAANYSRDDLSGKARCKAALQRRFGLPERPAPLFGMVSRFAWQKGTDLLIAALEEILALDLQVAVLGTGDPGEERALLQAAQRHPEKLSVTLAFNPELSHQVQAGSDFFLMPSRYEPCGLSQLFALAYGTIPVVRRTGGLVDTVRDLNPVHRRHGDATGIAFVPSTHQALARAVRRAVDLFADAALLDKVRKNGMAEDFSWDRASEEYVALYRQALAKA